MEKSGTVRRAKLEDCHVIAQIYNEGIAERRSTFETESRSADDVEECSGRRSTLCSSPGADGALQPA